MLVVLTSEESMTMSLSYCDGCYSPIEVTLVVNKGPHSYVSWELLAGRNNGRGLSRPIASLVSHSTVG